MAAQMNWLARRKMEAARERIMMGGCWVSDWLRLARLRARDEER